MNFLKFKKTADGWEIDVRGIPAIVLLGCIGAVLVNQRRHGWTSQRSAEVAVVGPLVGWRPGRGVRLKVDIL
ncbi:hypothetical protein [Bacillus wiedmannii]|uniref:hypothetical protein n=1 Tax=Bacillus wiedmannii TaxID=1890302 RepID=UPI00062D208F|nr:hypothetical protein [Bacillus wiedmannii]